MFIFENFLKASRAAQNALVGHR